MNTRENKIPAYDPSIVRRTGNPTGVVGVSATANEYLGEQEPPSEPQGAAGGSDAAGTGAKGPGTGGNRTPELKKDPTVMD